ncbi:DUF2848 family protein [Nocardia sp. NPDC049190]|uniref:DUF2848 family protein n=1 Tax=Nocardia sp. NPDC049190 TaxID=3155650 RepID=UPI0033FC8407
MLSFTVHDTGETIEVGDFDLVVAGYTGRDEKSVRAHIEELAAIGVAPPDSVPAFYELAPSLATQAPAISVSGPNTSGEVEPVLVRAGGRLFLTVGSDHTDRDIERDSVLESKAACPKPLGTTVIPIADLDFDALTAESTVDDKQYQHGPLTALRVTTDVLALYPGKADRDLILFGGTLPLLGGEFIVGTAWTISLTVPGGATLAHAYSLV